MSESVPEWAHEVVQIHPHDPRLAVKAQFECDRIRTLLAPWLVDGVEHIGSTAVPRLAAKPVIDIMASVTDPDVVVRDGCALLTEDGWAYVPPELDQRPWRRFFVKSDAGRQHRVAHLHLIQSGEPRWARQIAFRDALRSDVQLARRYEELKRNLARRYADDREAYGYAKARFIMETLERLRTSSGADRG